MALKIVYWASTVLAAVMLLFALSYLTGSPQIVEGFNHLGYPQYLRLVLGVAKPAAGIVILLPGLRLLKEWAYAGAAFAWTMAFIAHWKAGDGAHSLFPLVLLVFLIISYVTRPASRRLAALTVAVGPSAV
jgi:DoxX-like family